MVLTHESHGSFSLSLSHTDQRALTVAKSYVEGKSADFSRIVNYLINSDIDFRHRVSPLKPSLFEFSLTYIHTHKSEHVPSIRRVRHVSVSATDSLLQSVQRCHASMVISDSESIQVVQGEARVRMDLTRLLRLRANTPPSTSVFFLTAFFFGTSVDYDRIRNSRFIVATRVSISKLTSKSYVTDFFIVRSVV